MWTIEVDDKDLVTYEEGEMDEERIPAFAPVAIVTIKPEVDELKGRISALEALIGTIRQIAGCELRNISDINAEQHSREIGERFATLEAELTQCKEQLIKWIKWFEKTGDGSMAGLSDIVYREALTKWIEEGYLMSMKMKRN